MELPVGDKFTDESGEWEVRHHRQQNDSDDEGPAEETWWSKRTRRATVNFGNCYKVHRFSRCC